MPLRVRRDTEIFTETLQQFVQMKREEHRMQTLRDGEQRTSAMTADPQIIEQARSADPDARQKAAFLVAQSTDERNLPLMFELLGDKDWRVRKTIVDGLVRDARPEIVDGLLDALADAGERRQAQFRRPRR